MYTGSLATQIGGEPSAVASGGTSDGSKWRRRLTRSCILTLALSGLTACAGSMPAPSPATSYVVMDKEGPTGLKVTGFMPGCTKSCLDEVVRNQLASVAAAPVIVLDPTQPAPRRWFVIHLDRHYTPPLPITMLTASMSGPGDIQQSSSMSGPAYESAPQAVFEHSVAQFIARFFGEKRRWPEILA